MTDVTFSEAELEAIETLANAAFPEPGTRCPTCQRRVNKPRKDDSPTTRQMRITLPADEMEWAEEAFDALQQVVGADPYSYPRGRILQALLLLGGQERESLRTFFTGPDVYPEQVQ